MTVEPHARPLKLRPPAPINATMGLAPSLRRRLASESGFTLIEVLVVTLVMVILLIAITNVADTGRAVATRDGELALAVSESQPGFDRMVRELRQASAFNDAGCGSRANCVDFNVMGHTQTDASGNVIRPVRRVRYDCLPPGAGLASTSCRRYVSSNVAVAPTGAGTVAVQRVLNWDPASATPIFTYRKKDGSVLAAADALSTARTIDVSIQVPAKGSRKTGYTHNIVLKDGVDLKNLDLESAP